MELDLSIDYVKLAELVTADTTARTFLTTGGGVLLASLLFNIGREVWAFNFGSSEKINWAGPVGRVIVFALLIASYHQIYNVLVAMITGLGSFSSASAKAEGLFTARMAAIQTEWNKATGDSLMNSIFNLEALVLGLERVIVWLSFCFTYGIVYLLKHVQVFMLAVLLNVGPVLIGLASLGGVFNAFAISWLTATIETLFWGVTMNILLASFAMVAPAVVPASVGADGNTSPDLMRELVINMVYALSIASVPIITAQILRSQPGTALAARATGALTSMQSAVVGGAASLVAAGAASGASSMQGAFSQMMSRFGSGGRSGDGDSAAKGGDAAAARRKHFAIKDAEDKGGGRKGD